MKSSRFAVKDNTEMILQTRIVTNQEVTTYQKIERILNVFCATGEGGGVDPHCSPGKGNILHDGTTSTAHLDTSEAHFLGTKYVVNETVKSWKYKEPVKVLNEPGGEFERGGVKWRKAGYCTLASGEVVIHSPELTSVDSIKRLTAHEIMHGTFEKVYKQYDQDQSKIANDPSPTEKIKATGEIKPEHREEYPTYARLWRFREEVPNADFASDDGITDYSKAYWRDYQEGKVTFHIAVHETLAEIAGHHEQTGVILGSKLYKDYYKAVKDEYKVLTGSKKKRTGVGVVKNESLFIEHNLYLDSNFKPTTPEKAIWLRWWDANGENGWARAVSPTTNQRWRFRTSSQKTQDFLQWLRSQLTTQLLGLDDKQVWERYIQQGFRQGAGRSFDDYKKLLKSKGRERTLQQPLGFYQGTREEFLRSSFAQPVSLEKVQLLTSRVFTDLQGVSDSMATKMTRTLADGLTQGQSPLALVTKLTEDLDTHRGRAELIARTEIIRAHAEGQLQSLEDMGVEEVGVMVEWSTAGDMRVCKLCQPLQGVVLKLSEAKGMIPRHPQCRCSFTPANVGEDTSTQKRSKKEIQRAILSSQEKVKGDSWGPGESISKDRPESLITNHLIEFSRFLTNVFCPTGEGGGVDPTCGKGDSEDDTDLDEVFEDLGIDISRRDAKDLSNLKESKTLKVLSTQKKEVVTFDISNIKGLDRVEDSPAISNPNKIQPIIIGEDHELIDGHHRLSGLIKSGQSVVNVIVATQQDLQAAHELGGLQGRESWSEEIWIKWMVARTKLITANQQLTTYQRILNVFCPTGPGGGVDPTCSHGEGVSHPTLSRLPKTYDEALALASAARDAIIGPEENVCASEGDCNIASDLIQSLHPDVQTWYGEYNGQVGHYINKVGNFFIDITADQFGEHEDQVKVWTVEEQEKGFTGKFGAYANFSRNTIVEERTKRDKTKGTAILGELKNYADGVKLLPPTINQQVEELP